MKIRVEQISPESRKKRPTDAMKIAFGTVFTDHMFLMNYSGGAWHDPRIQPYQPLMLDPAAMVLHYAQGIFEGMKAYRRGDNIYLFRPMDNMRRLNSSAARLAMPRIDEGLVLEGLRQLLLIEKDWIPQERGTAIYIRPTMIATEPKLGVRSSEEYLFYIILSPVGPYFKEGFEPVRIYVSDKYVRAAPGGVGAAKAMGNYAASLLAIQEAFQSGHSQVLWLDAIHRKYLEEAGTMNVFVLLKNELVTPPLTGTILPGILRDAVIQLAREWGYTVNERQISIDEVIEKAETGDLLEMFGSGTAAIISPIGHITYRDKSYSIGGGKTGPLSKRLFDELTAIQCGEKKDTHGWIVSLPCS